jgi:penicillin-binding protein 1A
MRLSVGYAELVNGGKRIQASLIDRVQDRRGRTIYRHDTRPCPDCRAASWHGQQPPEIPDEREQILDPATAYQAVSLLQGVVERGTGVRISRRIDKPLGGKTGTTNDSNDTWFIGFSPDLVAGVYVGFDQPKTLGDRETGSSVAAPVFADFMEVALEDKPAVPFRIPDGVRLVRVNHETGLPARPGERNVIFEAFKPGTEPRYTRSVIGGSESRPAQSVPSQRQGEAVKAPETIPATGGLTGTGGLY